MAVIKFEISLVLQPPSGYADARTRLPPAFGFVHGMNDPAQSTGSFVWGQKHLPGCTRPRTSKPFLSVQFNSIFQWIHCTILYDHRLWRAHFAFDLSNFRDSMSPSSLTGFRATCRNNSIVLTT
ncbi:hypothetical protein MPTK1_4g13800 [Marchantia polymorpha subsp. ruderalis]|uniref:Uncharacterized protein n=2 Tax=Marchantia polymorpha TaxID=3197 RepID=A0AAF6B9M4_MARPO|nr:hypothetical protein MARPO_0202s0009 [Marchantia polymorpha]BBN08708.1 hypothetical protein Mp_4g13800 [Marchantia polymorpha subsp. ruderalis]|eukprot:PTQ27382.1 hypothetical protein MARPO_0202s0009 [Marchantia polymorpha]